MKDLSLTYRLFKGIVRLAGIKRFFRKSEREILAVARKEEKKVTVPHLSAEGLHYDIREFRGHKVIHITHREGGQGVCFFLIGGGMLKSPTKYSVKNALRIAAESGRDLVIPYYPLCTTRSIDEVYDWLYALYRSVLEHYGVSDMLVTGSSSGGTLALGLVSYLNEAGEVASLPKRIYASSPGDCFRREEVIARSRALNEKDILLDAAFMGTMEKIMTKGKRVPEYMLYPEEGNYRGLEEVYLSYGSDEVLFAAYEALKERLEEHGVRVISEIGENLFHCYPFLPVVPEARPGWEKMLEYHRVK